MGSPFLPAEILTFSSTITNPSTKITNPPKKSQIRQKNQQVITKQLKIQNGQKIIFVLFEFDNFANRIFQICVTKNKKRSKRRSKIKIIFLIAVSAELSTGTT